LIWFFWKNVQTTTRFDRARHTVCCVLTACIWLATCALAQAQTRADQSAPQSAPSQAPTFEIRRFVFEGASLIPHEEFERRTRPFTGPNRSFADVQKALEAVERAYSEAGYNAVQVVLPE